MWSRALTISATQPILRVDVIRDRRGAAVDDTGGGGGSGLRCPAIIISLMGFGLVNRMAAKKPPKKGEKPQKERFIEAAKAAGVDGDAFERVMGKIAQPKKPKR